ncbi:MAG TPA: hypothetical protein VLT82_21005 [Myxococcaceae bacterium]|nr:hypothetical protein [Myxococcaceae bacterium]
MYPQDDSTRSRLERGPGLLARAARLVFRRSELDRDRVARGPTRDRWGEIQAYRSQGTDPSLTQEELALMK